MPELILHIGAPKTGTSLLQVLFAQYWEALQGHGIYYPPGHMFEEARLGKITSGNGVEMANYIQPSLPHNIPDKEQYLTKFQQEIEAANGKSLLYSCEFLQFLDNDASKSIRTAALEAGYKARVIFFVRDFGPAAFSTYSQQIKRHGETRSFAEYLETWDPHYSLNLLRAENIFGRPSLRVFNFDEQRERLASFFFKDILKTEIELPETGKINRSLNQTEAELVRLMNSTTATGDRRLPEFVSSALMAVEPEDETPFILTREERDLLQTKFGDAIEFINKRLSGRPVKVADKVTDQREELKLSPIERALTLVIARLVSRAG